MLLVCLAIAVATVYPCKFIIDWFIIAIKQVVEEGGNGYTQPHWATVNEILGLNNIYKNINTFNGGIAFERSSISIIVSTISSLLIGLMLILDIKTVRKRYQYLLNLSAYLLTGLFIIYVYKSSPLNNYGYMKMYIFLLPLIYVYFIKVSFSLGEFLKLKGKNYGDLIVVALAMVMVINGISYVINYKKTSYLFAPKYLFSHEGMKNLDLTDKIFLPVLKSKYPNKFPALLGGKWITYKFYDNKILGDRYFDALLDRKVYLFIEKSACDNLTFQSTNIYYEDNNFIIVDTGKILRSNINDGYLSKEKINKLIFCN